MRHEGAQRRCDACGRTLAPGQVRFCTNVCRAGFRLVFGMGSENTTPSTWHSDGDTAPRIAPRSNEQAEEDEQDGMSVMDPMHDREYTNASPSDATPSPGPTMGWNDHDPTQQGPGGTPDRGDDGIEEDDDLEDDDLEDDDLEDYDLEDDDLEDDDPGENALEAESLGDRLARMSGSHDRALSREELGFQERVKTYLGFNDFDFAPVFAESHDAFLRIRVWAMIPWFRFNEVPHLALCATIINRSRHDLDYVATYKALALDEHGAQASVTQGLWDVRSERTLTQHSTTLLEGGRIVGLWLLPQLGAASSRYTRLVYRDEIKVAGDFVPVRYSLMFSY